jgi:hypothetical protein
MGGLRTTLLVLGILAILVGVVWVGQGTGYFPYPSSSFMINQKPWIYRGLILAVAGVVVVAVSRWT